MTLAMLCPAAAAIRRAAFIQVVKDVAWARGAGFAVLEWEQNSTKRCLNQSGIQAETDSSSAIAGAE